MYNDDSILTWGKWKFTAIKRIPASWLLSKHENKGVHDKELVAWVGENLDRLKERHELEIKNGKPVQIMNTCTKYQYASQEEAEKHLREIRAKGQNSSSHVLPVRAYHCNKCPFWHLTSIP